MERKTINLLVGDDQDGQRKNRARLPMNPRAYRYLRVLYKARTCPYVIEWAGHRVLSIKKGFKAAVVKAGLDGVTPHTPRHTGGSWMAEAGVPMFEIAKFLGHTDMKITYKTYAHPSPDYHLGAASKLKF